MVSKREVECLNPRGYCASYSPVEGVIPVRSPLYSPMEGVIPVKEPACALRGCNFDMHCYSVLY